MNANQQRFWMIADESQWRIDADLRYDQNCRLHLASERDLPPLPNGDAPAVEAAALARLELVPEALDAYGTRARWDAATGSVLATGALPDPTPILVPPDGQKATDLALGTDGVLYLAVGGDVVLLDRRGRWPPVTLKAPASAPDFAAWRLAALPNGGVVVLDRANRRLARVRGLPLRDRPFAEYSPNTARPCEENPDPPRIVPYAAAVWPADETPVGMASSPGGQVALLSWGADGQGRVRCLSTDGTLGQAAALRGAFYPYSLAWVDEDRVAVLLTGVPNEASVYAISALVESQNGSGTAPGGAAEPVGDFFPLVGHDGGPFLHVPSVPPEYPVGAANHGLYPISLPSYARRGQARGTVPFDSGAAGTVWDRAYLEARIPPGGGVSLYLAATDDPTPPSGDDADSWHEHRFGEVFAADRASPLPRGAWTRFRSEVPFQNGLLARDPEKDRSGLFTVLIQRTGRRVSSLRGRYLHSRIVLVGDGRTTPEVVALRAYAPRFSYAEHYLPELYRETEFGPDADRKLQPGESTTRADFLERFLDLFEGILTPLEDRIANAHRLTDPRTVPEESLDWLGSWIGVAFDPIYPTARRRALLEKTPELYRWRGTLRGLTLALDVATSGAVRRGEVVILEDFRLRRTFATILGADLSDHDDPLFAGTAVNANSYVGDTLFLGDEHRSEFLALFGANLPTPAEERAILAFFDQLANRVSILVHRDLLAADQKLIQRVVDLETPAHVVPRVLPASQAFVVGVASLVAVDTYLGVPPEPRPVEVGWSSLGVRDFLRRLPSLDPRLEGISGDGFASIRPVAALDAPPEVELGGSIHLSGAASRAAPGERITRYRWKLIE